MRETGTTRVRLHKVTLAVALWGLLGLPAVGAASPIIQDLSNEARNISPWVGQSFTAEDALIDTVGVFVVDFTIGSVATDSTIVYDLYDGFGWAGTLLGSRTYSGLSEGFDGYADVSFAGIPLVVGSIYTLRVSNDTLQWGVESDFAGGGVYYPGGTALLPPSGGPGTPPRDLRFHVLPEVVPEPGTVILLGTGIGAAALRRFRARRPPSRCGKASALNA
jgi:hypothetical protein